MMNLDHQIHGKPPRRPPKKIPPVTLDDSINIPIFFIVLAVVLPLILGVTFYNWADGMWGTKPVHIEGIIDGLGSSPISGRHWEINDDWYFPGRYWDDYSEGDYFEGELYEWTEPGAANDLLPFVTSALVVALSMTSILGIGIQVDKRIHKW